MGKSIRKNKSIKKSRKKYLKRNKTKGKTREYRRTKNKRHRNKKSKNKRLTKRNKRYSNKSRKKFIRKKKIYQEGGVDIDFGTLTSDQVGILTYGEVIRRYMERFNTETKNKICRITGYVAGDGRDLPKMLMMDRKANAIIPMLKIAPSAEHITYSVGGAGKRIRAEYKPVSELCYWMIKVAEKGAQSGQFSPQFEPSTVTGGSICMLKNPNSLTLSAGTLKAIFHNLLDLIKNCLEWYKTDYAPHVQIDTIRRKELLESQDYIPLKIFNDSIWPYLQADFREETGISVKGKLHIDLNIELKELFREKNIPHTYHNVRFANSIRPEIGEYMELCAKLGFFNVMVEDERTMLDFMIDHVDTLKGILDASFFEELVQTERAKALTGWTDAAARDAAEKAAEAAKRAAAKRAAAISSAAQKAAAEAAAAMEIEMDARHMYFGLPSVDGKRELAKTGSGLLPVA